MELTYSNQSYFFSIATKDLILPKIPDTTGFWSGLTENAINALVNQDIVNFQITEELGRMVNGTLTLRDPSGIYSKIFVNGMEFTISWGYKKWNTSLAALTASNTNQLFQGSYRKGVKCIVQTPGGSGNEQGEQLYDISFICVSLTNPWQVKVYNAANYFSAIEAAMIDLGCKIQIINFRNQYTILSTDRSVMQYGGSYSFLLQIAREEHCLFAVNYTSNGDKIGLFIDSNLIDSTTITPYFQSILGFEGSVKLLYFNSGNKSNVRSYTWKHHVGESGQGDDVSIQFVNGQYIFTRRTAGTQTFTTYKLDSEKVRKSLEKSPDLLKQIETQNYLAAKTFEDIKWAFTPIVQTTSPEGIGFTVNGLMVGDPMLTPGMRASFQSNFPAPLRQDDPVGMSALAGVFSPSNIKFFFRKLTHNIDKNGYHTDFEICDTYTAFGAYIENTGVF